MMYRCELKYAVLNPETMQYEPVIIESWHEMRSSHDIAIQSLDRVEEQIKSILEKKHQNYKFLAKSCTCA